MNSKELKSKINELEYDVSDLKIKKAGYIRLIFFILATVIGGGVVLGILFGSLAKLAMLATAISVFTSVGAIKGLDETSSELKYVNAQIADYKEQIKKLDGKKNTNKVTKEIKQEEKKDYSFKHEDSPKKNKEVKIETFSEEDFDDAKRR